MTKSNKAKLNGLAENYGKNKTKLDALKKEVDADNEAIKSIMAKEGLEEYEHAGWSLKYGVQRREKLNEEGLLEFIKKNCPADCLPMIVRTKEYIDMDNLESAIFKGLIDEKTAAKMDKYVEVQEVPTLKVKAVKKTVKKGEKK